MPSDDVVKKAVAAATKQLNEELEELKARARGSEQRAAASARELQLLRPLLRDGYQALTWATRHPDYAVGGKHHRGFIGTAVPVLTRLANALSPARQASSLAGSDDGAAGGAGASTGAGGSAAGGTGAGAEGAGTVATTGVGAGSGTAGEGSGGSGSGLSA